jgi:hypothetical protein
MWVISFCVGAKIYVCPVPGNLVVRHSSSGDGDWKLRSSVVVFEACVITPALVLARKITAALVLSTKKSGKRRNSKINAVCDYLGEVRVGAKLLAEANEDEGLNQPV